MAIRKVWSYTDETGTPVIDEDVSVSGKAWASSAAAADVLDPNARISSQPRTNGWFDEIPEGPEHNYQFRRLSLLAEELEQRGFVAWSAKTDYTVPAIVWASDNSAYTATQASGPGLGGSKDPVANPLYWRPLVVDNYYLLPKNSIAGYVIAPGVPSDSVIKISGGEARAENVTGNMTRDASITKDIDGTWQAGDNQGGLFSGAGPSSDTTYHIMMIKNDTTGAIDAGFTTQIDASDRPAGWTAYRRVGSVITDGLGDFLDFTAVEMAGGALDITYKTRQLVYTGTDVVGVRRETYAKVPTEIQPIVKITARIFKPLATGSAIMIFQSPFESSVSPEGNTDFTIVLTGATGGPIVSESATFNIAVDNAANIAHTGNTELNIRINSLGYIDRRVTAVW